MARESAPLFGRSEQWAALNEASRQEGGALVLLRGGPGEGKTALLHALTDTWRREGAHVYSLTAEDDECTLQTIDALLDAARRQLEVSWDGAMVDALATATKLRAELRTAPSPAALRLVHEIAQVFAVTASRHRTVLVIEDGDRSRGSTTAMMSLLAQRLRAVGCTVLLSSRTAAHADSSAAQLAPHADRIVELNPLSDEDVDVLIKRWCAVHGRAKPDPTVPAALRQALGPLRGNPSTVLSTLDDLFAGDRLVLVDQHFCLTSRDERIALPEAHHQARKVLSDGDETERLAVLLALQDEISVAELPMFTAAAATNLQAVGRKLDSLVADGVLTENDHGSLRFAVPALATMLRRRSGEQPARALRTALARQMLARLERDEQVDRQRLVHHLVCADEELDIGSAGLRALVEEAERVAEFDPESAAERYQVALRTLPEDDDRRPTLLSELLRLRASLGHYQELTEDLASLCPELTASDRALRLRRPLLVAVGTYWLTTLLQEDSPASSREPARLLKALGGGTVSAEQLRGFASAVRSRRFDEAATRAESLFGDQDTEVPGLPNLPEALALLHAARGDAGTFEQARSSRRKPVPTEIIAPLREAAAMTDHATALSIVFGDDYRLPAHGSALYYREVLLAFRRGEWDAALSAARRMEAELPAQEQTASRHLARAFAAEIYSCRGEDRRAKEWLADTSPDIVGGHVLSWIRLGVHYRAGDREEALREAKLAAARHWDGTPVAGLERLLHRMFCYYLRDGRDADAAEMLAQLEELDRRMRSEASSVAALTARSQLHRAPEPAQHALEIARRHHDAPQLALLHLVLAQASADPKPWLHEAHTRARRLNWGVLRHAVQDSMREHGIAPPRARTKQELITSTESNIVRLVSDGYTNRQIAVAIRVSEKTVESRLTRLFALTGCRSRVELATASLEGRLVEKADT